MRDGARMTVRSSVRVWRCAVVPPPNMYPEKKDVITSKCEKTCCGVILTCSTEIRINIKNIQSTDHWYTAAVENPTTELSLMLTEFYPLASIITGTTTNVLISESTYTNAPHMSGKYYSVCANTPWRITFAKLRHRRSWKMADLYLCSWPLMLGHPPWISCPLCISDYVSLGKLNYNERLIVWETHDLCLVTWRN